VEQAKESNVYTCGSELLSLDHLASAVIVRIGITCQSPIETTYYAATRSFPRCMLLLWRNCADLLLDDPHIKKLKQQFATVRPLCRQRRNAGKEAKTRAPNNMAPCAKGRKLN